MKEGQNGGREGGREGGKGRVTYRDWDLDVDVLAVPLEVGVFLHLYVCR